MDDGKREEKRRFLRAAHLIAPRLNIGIRTISPCLVTKNFSSHGRTHFL